MDTNSEGRSPKADANSGESKGKTGLWRYRGVRGGKYLVLRRDGTRPKWPHFVIGAADPCAPEALRAYASEAARRGLDANYVADVRRLAQEFEVCRELNGSGDPDAGRHRVDDPATVARMCEGLEDGGGSA